MPKRKVKSAEEALWEAWSSFVTVEPGSRWRDRIGPVRVLAVCEGYVMVRRPRAVPFVQRLAEFITDFEPVKRPATLKAKRNGR